MKLEVTDQTLKPLRALRNPVKWQRLWLLRKHLRNNAYREWWLGLRSADTLTGFDHKASRALDKLGYRMEYFKADESVTDWQPEAASGSVTCIICGADMSNKRSHSRTCSPKCRKALSRRK